MNDSNRSQRSSDAGQMADNDAIAGNKTNGNKPAETGIADSTKNRTSGDSEI